MTTQELIDRPICCTACLEDNKPELNCKCVELNNIRHDIDAFTLTERSQNDDMNKKREAIVEMIINNTLPCELYQCPRWVNMRKSIHSYVYRVMEHAGVTASMNDVKCIGKAGRGHNHDFVLKITDNDYRQHELKVELKFNATTISDAPQFVSPMKPSQYMSSSYEEFYYDCFLPRVVSIGQFPLPPKELYMKQIHGNKPACMRDIQEKYYAGCRSSSKYTGRDEDIQFYTIANNISKESISSFIANNELNITKLGEYLKLTQEGKYYMMYRDDEFHMETVDMDEYDLVHVEPEPSKYRFMVTTKTGRVLKVLLRWKNGNGIAYPAFQIS